MTLFVLEAINFSKKSVEEINFSGRELTAWMESWSEMLNFFRAPSARIKKLSRCHFSRGFPPKSSKKTGFFRACGGLVEGINFLRRKLTFSEISWRKLTFLSLVRLEGINR